MTEWTAVRAVGAALRLLPDAQREIGHAMLAETAALEPGRTRRKWWRSTWWFIIKAAAARWLRWGAILGSALFILWIVYNAVDSSFQGTPPEIASSLGLIALLALNTVLLARRSDSGGPQRPDRWQSRVE